ncbi:MAG: CHASE2 domain-containing protein [Bacteroidetes bacterium]|nr:CHASE2 domain-containing protein [Bacteroidota bacterium]
MRKRLVQYIFRLEYLLASLLVMLGVQVMIVISESLPEADETSFLNPILDRIDFLNIADVSLDAIFAVKDMEYMDDRIYVINIGEAAPAPDGKIAALLYRLQDIGAAVIGVDVIFDEMHLERFPPERLMEVEDLRLAIRDVPNVVLVNGFDPRNMQPTFDILPPVKAVARHYGFANLVPDPDGVVRRFLPYAVVDGERWLSFPLKMLELYDPSTIDAILRQPAEPQIVYYTSHYSIIPNVPIDDVLFSTRYDDVLKGKIIIVGFVNEGGMFYLDDTHKTPLGRKMGIEGPDMPGAFIHANVINMLLTDRFIEPIPGWGDWLLVFLLSYLSIALYRTLRTKPPGRFHVAVLITVLLFTEAVVVFFLPLIAFFYFDWKISYNLMATAVLLFIPANAFTTWLRFQYREQQTRRAFRDSANPLPTVLTHAFADNEPFLAHTRLMHAALTLPQFAYCYRLMEESGRRALTPDALNPRVEQWEARIPEIAQVMETCGAGDRDFRYFLRFLAGKRSELLRESLVKERYLSTELQTFNEFVYFEEWELMLPHVMRLWEQTLRVFLHMSLRFVPETGIPVLLSAGGHAGAPGGGTIPDQELPPGLYGTRGIDPATWIRLSPLCEWAECKLHRKHELFIFNGLMYKQHGLPPVPAFFGQEPNCEPVLPMWTMEEFQAMAFPDNQTERRSV